MTTNQSLVDKFLQTMKLTAASEVNNSGLDHSQTGTVVQYDQTQTKPYYIQMGDSTIQARSSGAQYYVQDVVYVTQYGGTEEYVISGLQSRIEGVVTNATIMQDYDFLSGNLWSGSGLDLNTLKVLTTSVPKTEDNEEFIGGNALLMTFDLNGNVSGVTGSLVTVTIDGSANTFTIDDVQGALTNVNNESQIFIVPLDKTPTTVQIELLSSVQITNFKAFVVREAYEEKTNSLVIAPIDKYKFTSSDTSTSTITLAAQLRKNGLVEELSDTSCYWFIEEPLVDSVEDGNYSIYGGKGWRALNEVDTETKELKPMEAKVNITFNQIQRYNVGFKCIATDANGVKETSNIFRIINDAVPHLEVAYNEETQVITTALKIGEDEIDYTDYTFSIPSGTNAYGEKLTEDLPTPIDKTHNFQVDETKIGIFNTYIVEAIWKGNTLVDRQSIKVEKQGLFGGNGTEALTLALDNDSDIFVKTKAGEVIGVEEGVPLAVINVTAYAGSKDVTFDEHSYIDLGTATGAMTAQFVFDPDEHIAQLQITGINTNIVGSKGSIEIVWKNSKTTDAFVYATKKFTYNIITANADYDLILTKTVVNTDGKEATDELSNIVVQKKLSDGTINNLKAPDGYIEVQVNGKKWGDETTTEWPAIKLEQFQVKNEKGTVIDIQDVKVEIISTDNSLGGLVWDTETIEAVHNGEKGDEGSSYTNVVIKSTSQIFKKAINGSITPSSVTLTPQLYGDLNATGQRVYWYKDTTLITDTSNSKNIYLDGNNLIVKSGAFGTATSLNFKVEAYTGDNKTDANTSGTMYDDEYALYLLSDGANGDPAYSAFLTDPSIGFSADADGKIITDTTKTLTFKVFKGLEEQSVNITSVAGWGDKWSEGTTSVRWYKINGAQVELFVKQGQTLGSAESCDGTVELTATTNGKTFNLNLSWDKTNTGKKGADSTVAGPAGYSGATVTLYKRIAKNGSMTGPTGTLTYTFKSEGLSGDTASFNGWKTTIVETEGANPCYAIYAYASNNTDKDTILKDEWTDPILIEGTNGTNGINTATVFLYQRTNTVPTSIPTGVTYTFSSGAISGTLGDWSITIPASNGNPCYYIQAVAASSGTTDTISNWSDPAIYTQDGENGTSSTAAVEEYPIYYAGSTPPSLPATPDNQSDPSSLNNWQNTKPTLQNTYIWRSIAARTKTVIKKGETTISTTYSWGAWSAPQVIEALGSSDAQTLATINNFMAVTNGGENKGIYYAKTNGETVANLENFDPATDELHINASMINAGVFKVADGDKTVFSAAAGGTEVTIGNFNVTATGADSGAIYSGKESLDSDNAGVYLGTDGIALGSENIGTIANPEYITPFKVDSLGNFYSQKGQIAGWNLNSTSFISDDGQFKIQSNLASGDNNYLELGLSDALTGQFIQQFENGIQINSDGLNYFRIGVENNAVYQLEVGPNIKIQQVIITAQVVVGHDDGNNDFTVVLTPYIYDWEDSDYTVLNEKCSYDGNILFLDMAGNVNTEFYFKKENSDEYSNDILDILYSMGYNYNPEFVIAYLEMTVEYKTNSFIIDSEGKITSPTILSLQSHIANLSGKLNPSLTVNNGELIIQQNNGEIGRFSANSAQTKTINIIVPTVLSDLDIDEKALATTAEIDALFNNLGQS